jgi:small nuclear ribonucleoprotein (snRNP)-like protein
MKSEDKGKEVIVIVSDNETVKGTITEVVDEDIFEVEDQYGNRSRWNERQIKGIKFKGRD